jgi:hypothetical protein
MVSNEIERRKLLEKYLRLCVDDVKAEIVKKKSEKNNSYCKILLFLIIVMYLDTKNKSVSSDFYDDRHLSIYEKEKIV